MWAATKPWLTSASVWRLTEQERSNQVIMRVPTEILLNKARQGGYAVGAFNVYTLEGIRAVTLAAERTNSPVILQMLPRALEIGGTALIAACLEAARAALVPMAVHLDHCSDAKIILAALEAGISSVMADGSHLPYDENLAFTRRIVQRARSGDQSVEAELGRLSGSEDGLTVAQREARLTDPDQARTFVAATGVQTLAVCIGNVHGTYHTPPDLDFDRLQAIADRVAVPLVLHGTSGLPDEMITRAVDAGVCKFNVNTELRQACLMAGRRYLSTTAKPELVARMETEIGAMTAPVIAKMKLFRSEGKASQIDSLPSRTA